MPEIFFERNVEAGTDTYDVGSVLLPQLVVDINKVTQEMRNEDHSGQRLLCMAAIACFVNTFGNALKRNGAEIKYIKASADTEKHKDHALRTRYDVLILNMEVGLEEKYREAYNIAEQTMLDGSLLTYSLEAGMEVEYNLEMVAV